MMPPEPIKNRVDKELTTHSNQASWTDQSQRRTAECMRLDRQSESSSKILSDLVLPEQVTKIQTSLELKEETVLQFSSLVPLKLDRKELETTILLLQEYSMNPFPSNLRDLTLPAESLILSAVLYLLAQSWKSLAERN